MVSFNLNYFWKKNNGLTLVELLVVIAIISLIITISIMAFLRYQKKSVDTRIEITLIQARNVATMLYQNNSNYDLLCDTEDNTLNDGDHGLYKSLKIIEQDINAFSSNPVNCYSDKQNYCIQASLVSDESDSFCIDSNGSVGRINTNCSDSNIKCAE